MRLQPDQLGNRRAMATCKAATRLLQSRHSSQSVWTDAQAGRAHGALGMPAELLRYARDLPQHGQPSPQFILAGILTAFLNHMFTSGRVPVACNQALVTPMFKRGDKLDPTSYRPIAVTEPLMRLYAGMLNARLLDYTDSNELRANTQAGFRPGHSVLHQVFTIRHMMQRQQHHGSKLFICLLDLKGAYDRVSRPLLWQALQRLGVHGTMLTAIQAMYATATGSVRVRGRSGPILPSRTGVRQGCPLSPTLFGLLADGVHNFLQGLAISEGVPLGAEHVILDLAYADDFILMSPTASGIQLLVDASVTWCAIVGMQPSPDKIVCMEPTSPDSAAFQCTCAGRDLQIVQEIKYLGVCFAPGVGMALVCKRQRSRMCGAFAEMKRQYSNLGCAQLVGLRMQLFAACVQPVGSFASEVWGVLPFTGQAKSQRAALIPTHLGMLKELAGLLKTTPILYMQS